MSLSELFDLKPIGNEWIFEQLVTYILLVFVVTICLANRLQQYNVIFNEYIIDDVTVI